MLTKTPSAKKQFDRVAPPIFLSRQDLHKALFIGPHYECDLTGSQMTFFSNGLDVSITAPRPLFHRPRNIPGARAYPVECTIQNVKTEKMVQLSFIEKKHLLQLVEGRMKGHKQNKAEEVRIGTAKDLSAVLTDIYQTVRSEVDPKWAVDRQLAREAREAAAQILKTGMSPYFEISDKGMAQHLIYRETECRPNPACQNNCKKCTAGL